MKKNNLKMRFSICMPVYNGAKVISPTIKSILSQSFSNFDLVIVDDCSKDNSKEVIKSFKDKRIKYYRNEKNLGYSGNIEKCRQKATGDILYLMGQDDILGEDALLNTAKAFERSEDIGVVTRPYFWFDEEIEKPVRAKKQLNPNQDEIVSIKDDPEKIVRLFETLDQLSGLAYKRKFMDLPFHPDIFPCHVYPFVSIFKKHPAVFLKDYNIAVRIGSSQTRSLSSIYVKSPMRSWREMFENVFPEERFKYFRKYMIKNFVATNYVGLVQLRNYARFIYFLREVFYLLKYRLENITSFEFWCFSLGCLLIPPFLLIPMVDWYKNNIISKKLNWIKFKYSLE